MEWERCGRVMVVSSRKGSFGRKAIPVPEQPIERHLAPNEESNGGLMLARCLAPPALLEQLTHARSACVLSAQGWATRAQGTTLGGLLPGALLVPQALAPASSRHF